MKRERTRFPARLRRLALVPVLVAAAVPVLQAGTASAASVPINSPVDPNLVIQDDFQGFGTSLAWWADVVGGWAEPQRTELMDLLFSDSFTKNGQTVQGLDMNVVRYNLGASEPGVEYPVVDPHLPPRNGAWIESLIKPDGTYDWTLDQRQRWVLEQSVQRGAGTFELFANSAPWFMTHSGIPSGRYSRNSWEGCEHSNIKSEHEDDFADYMATVAQRFETTGINGPGSPKIDFETIEPFNEPSNGWWCWGNNQEGTYVPSWQMSSIISNLQSELDGRSLDTGISATDSNNYWLVVSEYDSLSEEAKAELDQINAHGYAGSDAEPVRDRVEARDMRFWQSEWGPAGWGGYDITSELDAALELATRVTNDLTYVESNAWLYWQAIEDSTRGDGPGFWGLIQATLDGSAETYDIQKQFYTLGQYSKFIKPGDLLIDAGNGKSVAGFDPESGRLSLVVYNDTAESLPVNFDLSRFSLSGGSAQAWRTSATEDLAQLPSVPVSGSTLGVTVPAGSVATYVLNGVSHNAAGATAEIVNDSSAAVSYAGSWSDVGYSGAGQGAYGLWDQDEHSSQSAGATATYTFHGTKATLFGTKAPTSGKIAVSVDGGPETVVNLHNSVRVDGVHVFTSGALADGRHTLRVRITGEAGAAGGGTWGNVDRVVVESSGWTHCAEQGQTCAFTGTAEVRYGANGDEVRSVRTGGVACTDAALGNPTSGAKECHYRPLANVNLVPDHSGKCAGVADSSATAGADVIQWGCTGVVDQRWNLAPATGGYRLSPAHASGQCLDVEGGSTAPGADVVQWTCSSAPNQVWSFKYEEDGYYSVSPAHAPAVCLDVESAQGGDGADIVQYTCNGYPNQRWKLAKS